MIVRGMFKIEQSLITRVIECALAQLELIALLNCSEAAWSTTAGNLAVPIFAHGSLVVELSTCRARSAEAAYP